MTQSVRAILICLVAYLCFDLMSIHVRYLSARYSAQELSVYRNIFGILPSIVLLWYTRELAFDPLITNWSNGNWPYRGALWSRLHS